MSRKRNSELRKEADQARAERKQRAARVAAVFRARRQRRHPTPQRVFNTRDDAGARAIRR